MSCSLCVHVCLKELSHVMFLVCARVLEGAITRHVPCVCTCA